MRAYVISGIAVLLGACAAKDDLNVRDATAGATPPGATVAAVYMEISSAKGDTLLGASTPAAERVEMHTSSEEDGMMRMRPVVEVELPPGEPRAFEPGGMHMMLIGLRAPLVAGTQFPLTLRLRAAGEHEVRVTVRSRGEVP